MRSLVFEVKPWDAVTLLCVVLLVGLTSMVASFLPARRGESSGCSSRLYGPTPGFVAGDLAVNQKQTTVRSGDFDPLLTLTRSAKRSTRSAYPSVPQPARSQTNVS